MTLLRLHKSRLNLSSRQFDGSHTRTHNGGAAIGYQGRKAARTTNLLFLADNQGQLLACASPQAAPATGPYVALEFAPKWLTGDKAGW